MLFTTAQKCLNFFINDVTNTVYIVVHANQLFNTQCHQKGFFWHNSYFLNSPILNIIDR